ncbi:MAG: BrnT family toxin [Anaerolineales bacterium]|nr:BrnT family toxin [Anaerolineales bacterium]
MEDFDLCKGFDWDEWNAKKIWEKHQVSRAECEQVFFNQPFVVGEDFAHSQEESRFYVLGKTDTGRALFLIFTIRDELIRVITARDMSRKERRVFRDVEKENDS